MKPKPCPVCGHRPQVTHRWIGPERGHRGATNPAWACPKCRRACVSPEAMPGVYGAFLRPWTALQILARWNAGRVRRLSPEEAHLRTARGDARRAALQRAYPRPWAIRAADFDRLFDDGEDISRYLDWSNAWRPGR